ncbi:MAG TPA: rod-binding protein [Candidatus Baltobacteraceae bacterium]|nr:rod-binding protein [Candidatus Baltobacteraceae bacterium]
MNPIAALGSSPGSLVNIPAGASEPDRIKAAAQELEGVFLGLLMKTMRSTVAQGGLFKATADTESYRDLFDQEVGRSLAKAGGIGLAQLILRDQALRQTSGAGTSGAGEAQGTGTGESTQKRSSFADSIPIQPATK